MGVYGQFICPTWEEDRVARPCVCVSQRERKRHIQAYVFIHTPCNITFHNSLLFLIYIYMPVCVCVCVCVMNSMQLIPAREASSCEATQEIPHMLWNPKIHYRLHKSQPMGPILSHINPAYATTYIHIVTYQEVAWLNKTWILVETWIYSVRLQPRRLTIT
jgi:hypothetical protein